MLSHRTNIGQIELISVKIYFDWIQQRRYRWEFTRYMRKPTNMSLCFTRKWSGVQVPHHPPVFKALLDNGRRTDIGQVLKKPGIIRAVIWVWALESYIFLMADLCRSYIREQHSAHRCIVYHQGQAFRSHRDSRHKAEICC